jgi:hypothetical protein
MITLLYKLDVERWTLSVGRLLPFTERQLPVRLGLVAPYHFANC